MNDRVMRLQIGRFGLRVVCLACGWEGRHFPESQGRLRSRLCICGNRGSMRSKAWVTGRGQEKAVKLVREYRAMERVFAR